jgi:hypothetical protein
MGKYWSYRAQAICSLRNKAGGTDSYCCVVRFPACYFWLAFCDPYQSLQVNSMPIDRGHLFLSLYSLYLSLDAFTSLRKDSIIFVCSVYQSIVPSVRLEQDGSHWTNIHEFWYLKAFRKSVEKLKYDLKSEKNSYNLHECLRAFMIIFRWILLRRRNVSDKRNSEHVFCFKKYFPKFVLFMRLRGKI